MNAYPYLSSDYTLFPLPHPLSLIGRWTLSNRIMGRYADEKPPTLLDKSFAYILGFKQCLPPQPPPQTSLSTSSRISSLNRSLVNPFSQSLNSRTNLSFQSSLTSPQTRRSPVTMRGSVFRIPHRPMITFTSGRSVCDG